MQQNQTPYQHFQQPPQYSQPPPNHHNNPNNNQNSNDSNPLALLRKGPYTQNINGQELTYSLLNKKQNTLFLTNERLLLLKGLEAIAYARELPPNTPLPFPSFENVPKPKTSYPLSEVEKCQAKDTKLLITFSGQSKVIWEFDCPSRECAADWAHRIEDATITLNEFKQSGFTSLEEFYRHRPPRSRNARPSPSSVNANYGGSSLASPQQMNYSYVNPLGAQQNNQMVSPQYQNFISTSQGLQPSQLQPQRMLGKSMSKIQMSEHDSIRHQLNKYRHNWLEELIGGEEEVQLIMDFKLYVERIAAVIINELYIPDNRKIFPVAEQTPEFISYILDDIYLQIYLHSEQTSGGKHPRYRLAALEFRNIDYLLTATKNEGNLKVPFMMLFEYKGFTGMAKSRIADSPPKNRQFYSQLNIREFEESSRISAQSLLNEQKCRILGYERRTPLSATTANRKIYIVDRLIELLPLEREQNNDPYKVLRPELLQDPSLEAVVFRDNRRPVQQGRIANLLARKVEDFIVMVEQEEEYFTNSQQLADLIHYQGLNISHLGDIYRHSTLPWLRRIIQAEIIARSLKSLFRWDIQDCVYLQKERNPNQQSQEDFARRRAIAFLNVIFGNSESTTGIWKRINAISKDKFGVVVASDNIGDTNVQFLMQAVQTHLKITMNDSIHKKIRFQSRETFEPSDFGRFEFSTTIYNLQFSNLFEQIDECLATPTPQSFYNLSSILIKETSSRVPYLEILKRHPIHDKISEFLLNFTSPQESKELYSRLEGEGVLPSRFLYESKLAEMKWFLKTNRVEGINRVSAFIFEHARKWLGALHPLFAQLNRLLASYYSNHPQHFQLALKHANESLQMQKKLFQRQAEPMWKDFFLLGKTHFNNKNQQEAMQYLLKARTMVNIKGLKEYETFSELFLLLIKGYFLRGQTNEAYAIVKELYAAIKNITEETTLEYQLQAVNWMRQIHENRQDLDTYFQFIENDVAPNIRVFIDHPQVLTQAIRNITLPGLRHALRKSRNPSRIISLVEETARVAQSTQSTLAGYLRDKITSGAFPRSFMAQLRDIDTIGDEVISGQLLERWRQFYTGSTQQALDRIGSNPISRGFQFLANLTALFNLFGRQVLDELNTADRR